MPCIRPTCAPIEHEMLLTPRYARSIIWLLTKRTGSPVIDEDLAQDALLRALQAFRRTPQVQHPRAFFRKVVKDMLADHWRHHSLPLRFVPVDDTPPNVYQPRFEETLDRSRRLVRLFAALDRLTTDKRLLLECFYLNGLTIREITQRLGKSPSAIKMGLARSRQELVRMVNRG